MDWCMCERDKQKEIVCGLFLFLGGGGLLADVEGGCEITMRSDARSVSFWYFCPQRVRHFCNHLLLKAGGSKVGRSSLKNQNAAQ